LQEYWEDIVLHMLLVAPIVRGPKESEMALSSQVKDAIDQASNHLRDALAFAARAEHPITISTITDILVRLESLECMEEIMQKFGKATSEKEVPDTYGS
jgi:hypothetical protein